MHPTNPLPLLLLLTTLTIAQTLGPVVSSSFTWNAKCGSTVACGPSAAGFSGTGFAAANNVTYAAGQPIVNGVGKGCGQCWHLMPETNAYSAPGKSLGTPVVVKINDQCTDPKYCDQYEFDNDTPLNTGYGKQVHFDLCHESGVTSQFFGEIEAGVALGLAQQVDCGNLQNGKFGQKLGKLQMGGGGGSDSGAERLINGGDLNTNQLGNKGGSGSSSSSAPGGAGGAVQSSTTPVVAGQPSTTLATVVGSASSSTAPSAGAGGVAGGDTGGNAGGNAGGHAGGNGDDEQDECDEL